MKTTEGLIAKVMDEAHMEMVAGDALIREALAGMDDPRVLKAMDRSERTAHEVVRLLGQGRLY